MMVIQRFSMQTILRLLLVSLVVFSTGVGLLPQTAKAVPVQTHNLYGTVIIAGTAAPDGVVVSANISGVTWPSNGCWANAAAPSTVAASGSYGMGPTGAATAGCPSGTQLFLSVLADNPDTSGVKDGGIDGDTILIYVDNYQASTATFAVANTSGPNSLKNLVVPSNKVIDFPTFSLGSSSISAGESVTATGSIRDKTGAAVPGATRLRAVRR